jgi:hypothetical protein
MVLTLKTLTKNGKQAIYTGLRTAIRIALVSFVDKAAPETLEIIGPVLGARVPRAKMTQEEKDAAKLARKNAPKPTLAERAARAQARAARAQARADKLLKQAEAEL